MLTANGFEGCYVYIDCRLQLSFPPQLYQHLLNVVMMANPTIGIAIALENLSEEELRLSWDVTSSSEAEEAVG